MIGFKNMMMHIFRRVMLVFMAVMLILPGYGFHKYHISTTHVRYSRVNTIHVISHIFIDDFEETLNKRYQLKSRLNTDKELRNIDSYITLYFLTNFRLYINKKKYNLNFIGKKYSLDTVFLYFETKEKINKADINLIEINSNLLTKFFYDQQNIVHIQIKDFKKSIFLTKQKNNALIKYTI